MSARDDQKRKSTADLVFDVASDVQMLVRKELELARIELMEGLRAQLIGAGLVLGGLIITLPGILFICLAIPLAISAWTSLSLWASFAIVGVGLIVLAAGAAFAGIVIARSRRPKIGGAIEQVKEDVIWARERLRS